MFLTMIPLSFANWVQYRDSWNIFAWDKENLIKFQLLFSGTTDPMPF